MKGWYRDNYRHSLAARGIASRYDFAKFKGKEYWRKKYPDLVKDFPGENPSIMKNEVRFRQQDPKRFEKDSFRTKVLNDKVSLILGKKRSSGKYELQSVRVKKRDTKPNLNMQAEALAAGAALELAKPMIEEKYKKKDFRRQKNLERLRLKQLRERKKIAEIEQKTAGMRDGEERSNFEENLAYVFGG